MKQTVVYMLASLYLLVNSGLSLSVHYCGGQIQSVNLNSAWHSLRSCCDEEKKEVSIATCCRVPKKEASPKDCCDNEKQGARPHGSCSNKKAEVSTETCCKDKYVYFSQEEEHDICIPYTLNLTPKHPATDYLLPAYITLPVVQESEVWSIHEPIPPPEHPLWLLHQSLLYYC